jgi:tetratricopeptide (TPR) repeat protein
MKKHLFFSLLVLFSTIIHGQNAIADSQQFLQSKIVVSVDTLEALLSRCKQDTFKVGLLGHLCYYTAFVQPEKGLSYGQQGLQLSQELNYKKGIAYCNQSLSFCLWALGNYKEALQFALKSLQQYEEIQDYKRIAYSYLALANVYREIGDYKKALIEAHKGIKIYDSINFSQKVAFAVTGSIYERQNQLDSALMYIQKAYELDIIHNGGNWGWLVYELGNIQAKMKHYDLALAYYRIALQLAIKDNYPKDIVDIYNNLAKVYKETGNIDSCIFYASQVLDKWKSTSYQKGMLQSANTLASVYKLKNQKDSTIKYLELGATLNQYLFNQEKEREFQNIAFNEQVRRQEKEHAEIQKAKEREKNLEMLAIAAFLVTFMAVVILISRNKSLVKVARFLGLIGVLLIFEFINLLTHPWIENITHHNPIWTLLILVLIASILVPTHHYFEDLIKKKLVRKRRVKRPKILKATLDKPPAKST